MKFTDFKFNSKLTDRILLQNYLEPTPIQAQAIPSVMEGKDVLGLAQTGTGKTAAFVLPLIHKFMQQRASHVRAVIIAPTRELAQQIHETVIAFGKGLGVSSVALYGGVSVYGQTKILRKGVDIVVGCPGRLLDHLSQRTLSLSGIETLVLDEADHMFDMGFLPDLRSILKYLPNKRQNLMFSATMPADIHKLANDILYKPVQIEVNHTQSLDTITHTVFPVKSHLKTALLLEIIKQTQAQSILIFTRTKHRAKGLDEKLQRCGYPCASLQGNLSQNRRLEALNGFKDGTYTIMVATDIAARGIDISRVSHVINYDLPDTPETYTHRIGRTGRASRTGDAYTLLSPEDADMMRRIERKLGTTIKSRTLPDFDYDAPPSKHTEFPRSPHPHRSSFGKPSQSRHSGRSDRSSRSRPRPR